MHELIFVTICELEGACKSLCGVEGTGHKAEGMQVMCMQVGVGQEYILCAGVLATWW